MAPLPQPGRCCSSSNIMYILLNTALLILLHVCQAGGACDYVAVIKCQQDSVKTLEAEKCDWQKIIPPIQTCAQPHLLGCNMLFVQTFETYLMQLNTSLQMFATDPARYCKVFACTGDQVEKVQNCTKVTPSFSTLLTQIKNGGAKGENISVQCSQAQAVIKCANTQATCPEAIAQRTSLLGDYSAVNQYCTTNKSPQDLSMNITVIIVITVLVAFIVVVNLIIIVIYVNRRRNRVNRMPRVIEPFRPSPEYYQYQLRR